MQLLTIISGVLVALAFLAAGTAKVTTHDQMVAAADRLGFTTQQFRLIGAAESAGAVGVLAGVIVDDLDALGIAAAVGLVIVGLAATATHLRAGDEPKDALGGAVLAAVAGVYILATVAA